MTDETKPELVAASLEDEIDGHGALIPVDHFHFNIIAVAQEAAKRFKDKTGKDAKYLYAPEALLYMLASAIKTRLKNAGRAVPKNTSVVNIAGMDLIMVPGTCITVTADPLHSVEGGVPPVIVLPAPETMQ